MKLRKLALTNCIANLFPFFPLIYLARVFNLIDDNMTKVAFMCAGAFTKTYFSSLCMDAHLEVSHSSVSLITAESMAHTSRREFLRFVFHELRGPLNSILLGAELLSAKVTLLFVVITFPSSIPLFFIGNRYFRILRN